MVDGGTRFRFTAEPEFPSAPPVVRQILDELRRPTTREEDTDQRRAGGRVVTLPQPQRELWGGDAVTATATVSGTRRQTVTLYVEDVVWIRLHCETGEVECQLKARALWAAGYEATAGHWLSTICWWLTDESCTLNEAEGRGWQGTGVEVCSDYVGLEVRDKDLRSFVGFNKNEVIRRFAAADGELQTLNLGTRASPVSLCLYDKDAEIASKAKKYGGTGGDDSCYRATHLAHGWDGDDRRRVEFRLSGRGLQQQHQDEDGVVTELDLRNPATLADPEARKLLWAVLCSKKRLVKEGSATRIERCELDHRWVSVLAASELALQVGWRQTRQVQQDTWAVMDRRARRDATRALRRVAALHDRPAASDNDVVRFIARRAPAEHEVATEYARRYHARHQAFVGAEMMHGTHVWAAVLLGQPLPLPLPPPPVVWREEMTG
jgi:hypothetical protein